MATVRVFKNDVQSKGSGMERVVHTVDIDAPPEKVWEIVTDATYLPKLYPDAISTQIKPPGRASVGQVSRTMAKIGRRKMEILSEVTELVPKKKIVTSGNQGSLFRYFEQVVTMERAASGTRVKMTFDYEYSIGIVGKLLNTVLVERLIGNNLSAYMTRLKEISELLPLEE